MQCLGSPSPATTHCYFNYLHLIEDRRKEALGTVTASGQEKHELRWWTETTGVRAWLPNALQYKPKGQENSETELTASVLKKDRKRTRDSKNAF